MKSIAKTGLLVLTIFATLGSYGEVWAQENESVYADLFPTKAESLASGEARYVVDLKRIRFSTEVEGLLFTKEISVFVNERYFASAEVDKFGMADINLDSRRDKRFPIISAGTLIEVTDSDGQLILSGIFKGEPGPGRR